MTQLNLFNQPNKEITPKYPQLCGVAGSYVFVNGIKNANFVVFNPLNIELKEQKPLLKEITLNESDFWKKIKSMTWSSNCRFFFVVNETNVIIGNTLNQDGFLCNLSIQIFDEFFKAFA